jgi:hypothetical protein
MWRFTKTKGSRKGGSMARKGKRYRRSGGGSFGGGNLMNKLAFGIALGAVLPNNKFIRSGIAYWKTKDLVTTGIAFAAPQIIGMAQGVTGNLTGSILGGGQQIAYSTLQ